MRPEFSSFDVTQIRGSNAVGRGNVFLLHDSCMKYIPYLQHVGRTQFCTSVVLPNTPNNMTVFRNTVSIIVCQRTEKKVGGVDARLVVAGMTDNQPCLDRTVKDPIRDPVGKFLLRTMRDFAIPIYRRPEPLPAVRWLTLDEGELRKQFTFDRAIDASGSLRTKKLPAGKTRFLRRVHCHVKPSCSVNGTTVKYPNKVVNN
jgi:hypothetical protein